MADVDAGEILVGTPALPKRGFLQAGRDSEAAKFFLAPINRTEARARTATPAGQPLSPDKCGSPLSVPPAGPMKKPTVPHERHSAPRRRCSSLRDCRPHRGRPAPVIWQFFHADRTVTAARVFGGLYHVFVVGGRCVCDFRPALEG